MQINFFNIACFIAAGIVLSGSLFRIFYPVVLKNFGQKLFESEETPFWVFAFGVFAILFIVILWFHVWISNVRYSWIVAILLSFSLIKSSFFILNYNQFKPIMVRFIGNKKRVLGFNLLMILYGLSLIGLGMFLY